MTETCERCERIDKWIDNVNMTPDKSKRYYLLVNFIKKIASKSCCNTCTQCIPCLAVDVLKKMGLWEDSKGEQK